MQATADRQAFMLFTAVCYGMQGTNIMPCIPHGHGYWWINSREGLGRREENAHQQFCGYWDRF